MMRLRAIRGTANPQTGPQGRPITIVSRRVGMDGLDVFPLPGYSPMKARSANTTASSWPISTAARRAVDAASPHARELSQFFYPTTRGLY